MIVPPYCYATGYGIYFIQSTCKKVEYALSDFLFSAFNRAQLYFMSGVVISYNLTMCKRQHF